MGAVKRIKNVEWEKNRRERLNFTFLELSRLLPDHDPTLTLTKLEILTKSISYIKNLQERNVGLLGTNHSEALDSEMTSLREQVLELQRRNLQLAELLQAAKITLPPRPVPHAVPMKCPRKWEGKLSPNTGAKNVIKKKKVELKENPVSHPPFSSKKKSIKTKKKPKLKELKNQDRNVCKNEGAVNSTTNPLRELNNASAVQSVPPISETIPINSSSIVLKQSDNPSRVHSLSQQSKTNFNKISVSSSGVKVASVPLVCTSVKTLSVPSVSVTSASVQTMVVISRPNTLPCTTISLVLSNSKTGIVTVAKSNVLPAPIMATGIQPVLQCNPSLSSLGPGTLIMPGGRIVPVPPPPTVLAPTLILLPPSTTTTTTQNHSHNVTATTTKTSQKPTNILRPIVPKPRQRDITKTTFANKVPIPAISTHRQGFFSGPKLSQNDHEHGTKRNIKKKIIMRKQIVKDKCTTGTSDVTSSKLTGENISELKSNNDGVIAEKTSANDSTCPEKAVLQKIIAAEQCKAKRKYEIVEESSKGPKIAKVVEPPLENIISCTNSKQSSQCDHLSKILSTQKFQSDINLKERTCQAVDNVPRQRGLHFSEKDKVTCENLSTVENLVRSEVEPFITQPSTQNQIHNVKQNLIKNRNSNVTSKSINCENLVQCTSKQNSTHTVDENIGQAAEPNKCPINDPTNNPQISGKDNHIINSDSNSLKHISGLKPDKSYSKETYHKVDQQISQSQQDGKKVVERNSYYMLKTASTDVKANNDNGNGLNTVKNIGENIIYNTTYQQTIHSHLKDTTKQKSEDLNFKDAYSKDRTQKGASTQNTNSTGMIVDSSTQINLSFGTKSNQRDMVLNQNSCVNNYSSGSLVSLQKSMYSNAKQKDQIEELTVNKNKGKGDLKNQNPASDSHSSNSNMNCNVEQQNDVNTIIIPGHKHHILEDTPNLEAERNTVIQPDNKHDKSKNEPILSEKVFSSGTGNGSNNLNETQGCHRNSCQNDNPNTSDQQDLCRNIYTKERKESVTNPHFNENEVSNLNLKTIPNVNNMHAPQISRNNNFNFEQPLHLCADPNSNNSNNNINSNLFNGNYNYHERVQKNVSNQTLPIPSKPSNNSVNFQNLHSNNNIKVDVNAQTNKSTNFYNLNCQKQHTESINVGKLQNTSMTGDYNFTKTYPCANMNTNSASNPNSSTKNSHFISSQNSLSNSALASNTSQNVTDTSYLLNEQIKHNTKTIDSNNIAQSLSSETNHKGSNQHHINISANAAKNNNFQNQQEVSKDSGLPNKFHVETLKTSVSQSCKSTQVTSVQLNFSVNEKHMPESKQQSRQNPINSSAKRAVDDLKSVCESKSLIQDDSQELTGLFPPEKLQSCPDSLFRDTCVEFRDRNLFMPVNHNYMEEMRLNLPHSDFSNDLLSSLQVPSTGQHPESISPTAAFLLAFPLVSTSKTSDLITENDGSESQHATPTTILQIGNIEPSSNELFHQTALMMENNPNLMKQGKNTDANKDISSKQIKDIEAFNKFQQIEINELMRNENFSKNNCKDKKTYVGLGEQDIFYQCTKKKGNGKTNNYPLPLPMAPHMPDKTFEFSQNNTRSNPEEDRPIDHSEKKNQNQAENRTSSQIIYNASSQPYSYNSFSSGNDFILPNSSYVSSNNHHVTESSKSVTLASSNFNVISWTTASITTNSTQLDYTTPYCNYSQKPFSNTNQVKVQKQLQTSFEDQRNKEKSTSNINPLPKFSNFQFSNNNNHSNQELHHGYLPNQGDSNNYKPEQKVKKLKTGTQRAPVNWMTAPDVRPLLTDNSVTTANQDVLFQQQKELDYPNAPNNMMLNSSSNITPFNTTTSTSNNSQSYYTNSHFSGVDLQLDFAPFPDIATSKPLRNSANVPNSQQNPHPYSWSPSKSTIPLIPHIDSHMIPSTLPTLVGDLALGTTTPSGPVDTFRNLSMPTTPFNIETPVKKYDKKQELPKSITKNNEKDCFPNSERRNNRTVPEYCQKTHNHQSTNTSSSFLSVSQLVDQVKNDQTPSSRRTTKPSSAKSNSTQKRNNQHLDKSKVSSNINNQVNYQNTNSMMSQRKFDTHTAVYHQDVHNAGVGFPGTFPNQGGPAPWQTEKPLRSSTHYKGSYSAESLIADQTTPVQGHITELPQFANQYSHPPVVSSASYPSADFAHQNVQPLEFHQTHQNCFNFPSNSQYPSTTFNSDSDYHLGLDHLFNFNPSSNKPSSCQTTKDNRPSGKRGQNKQRREEFTPQWSPHVYPPTMRPKVPLPPHCPPSTSSPSHQGTTTLTNFNLSTIFPEINDKVGMTGPPASSNFSSAPNFRSH